MDNNMNLNLSNETFSAEQPPQFYQAALQQQQPTSIETEQQLDILIAQETANLKASQLRANGINSALQQVVKAVEHHRSRIEYLEKQRWAAQVEAQLNIPSLKDHE
jgi:hypothetical protein